MTTVLDRFLKYVSFDTESAPGADCFPSTAKQKVFAQYLVEELKGIGIADAAMDEFGYVTGTLQSNVDFDVPVFGFISHMDTSPDMPGNNIKPQVIKNYDGGDIVLNKELGIVLSPKNFPKMLMYQGKDLITTDGTTLLGADNKAGITAIVGMVEYLLEHPEVKHGTIKIGFTPMKRLAPVWITSMWKNSVPSLPIRWTAVPLEAWSTTISTLLPQRYISTDRVCILVRPRGKWSTRCWLPWSFRECFRYLKILPAPKGTRALII